MAEKKSIELHCRVGNIEFCWSDMNKGYELLCKQPNPDYNGQERRKKDGWKLEKDGSMTKNISGCPCRIDSSCFKGKESSYVLAFVEYHGDGFDLRTVGLRPWELSEEDTKSFKAVLDFVSHTPEAIRQIEDGR